MSETQCTEKHADLIYDVGMHKGEDTDYYLRKGFRVIGIEANPELAAECRSTFSDEIQSGKLIIIAGAITGSSPEDKRGGKVKFYRNPEKTVWGTVAGDWADRNRSFGSNCEIIEVPVVDFREILLQHGIPHYLKIDIEGMDTLCLQALRGFERKPDYISIESEKVSIDKLVKELDLLDELGYTDFKAVQQSDIKLQVEPDPPREGGYAAYQFQEHASGLFGADLAGEWKGYTSILREYRFIFLQYKLLGDQGKLKKRPSGKVLKKILSLLLHRHKRHIPGWYDTHARHSSVVS